jgi:von Willebrand factor type A domain
VHGSLTFLTPLASIIGVLAIAPLLALAVALRRVRRARLALRLPDDGFGIAWLRALALASVPLLLALAIAQPVLRRHGSQPARADAAVFAVIDTSASMGAAPGPKAPTRLDRAKRVAVDVAAGLGGVPVGVASFTDRALPNLFPTIDRAVVGSTVRSLGIDSPPPRETSRVATSFAALGALERSSFYTAAETHRALLLITDGESRPFDAATLARTLAASPRVHVVVVRVGAGGDRLYGADGRPGSVYRSDPEGARQAVAQLVSATGGRSFDGGSAGVASALRSVLGSGPTTRITSEPETRALAPYVVLLSLIPLLVILAGPGRTFRASRRLH